jgi:hypothetical protein
MTMSRRCLYIHFPYAFIVRHVIRWPQRRLYAYPQTCLTNLLAGMLIPTSFTACSLVSCLAHSSTLKMEAIYSSKLSVDLRQSISRYTSRDRILYCHRCNNLDSKILNLL